MRRKRRTTRATRTTTRSSARRTRTRVRTGTRTFGSRSIARRTVRRASTRAVRATRARTRTSRRSASLLEMIAPRPSDYSYREERDRNRSVFSSVLSGSKNNKMVRNLIGFVLAFVAGIFATIQGYQGITGATITGNVIGTSIGAGLSGLGVIFGILIVAGAFLMVVNETMRFGGVLVIVLAVVSIIFTLGTSLVPSLFAIVGGFLGMTA